jgi:simple sugar transport system substrate-binding protein
MSDQDAVREVSLDPVHDAVERLEWAERDEDETPHKKWRAFTRRAALTGGAAGMAAVLLDACGGGGSSTSSAAGGTASAVFGSQPSFKFTLVNHVTTNPFFVPTKYGASDACTLLGCSYQWTGSETSNVNEMVNAMNSAITAKSDGIGVSLVDPKAFNSPTDKALAAGIPVLGYNADAEGNNRLAYIGQDLKLSGQEMGDHIIDLVPSGLVALFIATPGALNIQPRIDGAKETLSQSGKGITVDTIATGAAVPHELTVIDSYYQGHKSDVKGMFAVDAGSTQGVAQTIQKNHAESSVAGGGYDLLDPTQQLLAAGVIDFTIDQQPYLQGFFPILEMYMYQASQTLSGIADVNTGLKFLDKQTIQPYVTTKSRYEGTSTAAGVTSS